MGEQTTATQQCRMLHFRSSRAHFQGWKCAVKVGNYTIATGEHAITTAAMLALACPTPNRKQY
eukprot:m.174882 g.174882  ORF g.174882 m.174882 type:complete len:63 (+) comp18340_c0_seq1:1214-1402(+)